MMDLLTTPTSFPLELDWEGKMEPSSPSTQSQQSFAEDQANYEDDFYDYCNEGLFDNAILDFDSDLKPDLSKLLSEDDPGLPIVGKQEKDPWYDDTPKLTSGQSAVGYALLPAVLEDRSFPLAPEKTIDNATTEELLMEFDCVYENVELMNHLTPPQTPPQSSAFGGVGGFVIPIQQPLQTFVPIEQQQQQLVHPSFCVPYSNALPTQQQQMPFQGTGSPYYTVDEYATMTQLGGVVQQQPLSESLQQVPDDIEIQSFSFTSDGYTPQQMNEVENIVRSLQMAGETLRASKEAGPTFNDDDDSCGFSEAGSVESGASPSSLLSRSPAYSDSADSCYYADRNDRDDGDWTPPKSKKLNLSGSNGGAVTKKRSTATRPYGRASEDKKSRKKEQNKNAATRYRQKKKAEIEEILVVENELRERNEELKAKSTDLGRDIRCLKKLMRELLRKRGLI